MTVEDAPTMPLNCRTPLPPRALRQRRRAASSRSRARVARRCDGAARRDAARRRSFIVGRLGAGPVRVGGRGDLDRRQLLGRRLLRLRAGNAERYDGHQETGGKPEAALPRGGMVEDMVQASV